MRDWKREREFREEDEEEWKSGYILKNGEAEREEVPITWFGKQIDVELKKWY